MAFQAIKQSYFIKDNNSDPDDNEYIIDRFRIDTQLLMGEQGIILSCLLRLKTSCRFEFPHLCLQCTTHYSFISFLTATAEKKTS